MTNLSTIGRAQAAPPRPEVHRVTLSDTIDDALAWRLRLTADALRAAGAIDALATGMTLVAIAATGVALWHPLLLPVGVVLAVQILLGLVAKALAVRIRFEAAVFAALVGSVQGSSFRTEHLDRALRGVGMLRPGKEGRDWDTRCRDALRLVPVSLGVTTLQGLLFIVAATLGLASA